MKNTHPVSLTAIRQSLVIGYKIKKSSGSFNKSSKKPPQLVEWLFLGLNRLWNINASVEAGGSRKSIGTKPGTVTFTGAEKSVPIGGYGAIVN